MQEARLDRLAMAIYRKKPLEVKAEQWFPGKEVHGVHFATAETIYSIDRQHFYIRHGTHNPLHWLGVRELEGPVPEGLKKHRDIGWIEFAAWDEQPHRKGRTYHRKALSFDNWKLGSHPIPQSVETDDPFYLDYATTQGWDQRDDAYVITIHGQQAWLAPADWVITESDGVHHYPCKPDEFEVIYELIRDQNS